MLFSPTFDVSIATVQPVDVTGALHANIEQLLYREARLLDTRDFAPWLNLWTADGMYWVPHEPSQTSPRDHISLFWEDATLREVRVRRITNPRNWSQQPVTRTARIVGNVIIDGADAAGRLIVHSTVSVTEWRNGQRQLAGLTTHKLERVDSAGGGGWKIYLKRVDLINSTDAFANLEVFV
ncbi:aromatic-ring-hydroxylating dioxygenase subunit beta [Paraburkholderia nemoris]|uniref:Benzene 1,2-dioxygenase subunit beta n=1 Tax=Paraburkholderia nemoris TaxID=2793076 RepID=A0ABM8QYQ5_9BURK|nr:MULTISPECIES: aromatic-ring-hydroxylating dioxygenase subunit beta [Paraburkholderia]MBK3810095.1 aromatic-ring-hydroxylating dioxygenase subunit beta [Paraburkholderia aspalathi]CAE6723651.1 Benzene 1,2-dioxygenase subunit beta [Paraburkholderia nemoris]CAE6749430.1 Benzene 1,2-dioxygenase subunit beta [Paraburkholderia nemoris]